MPDHVFGFQSKRVVGFRDVRLGNPVPVASRVRFFRPQKFFANLNHAGIGQRVVNGFADDFTAIF